MSGKRNDYGSCPSVPAKVIWFDVGWNSAALDWNAVERGAKVLWSVSVAHARLCRGNGGRPTTSLQRTRFAPRDRMHFRNWFGADCLLDLDCAPLNFAVRRQLIETTLNANVIITMVIHYRQR